MDTRHLFWFSNRSRWSTPLVLSIKYFSHIYAYAYLPLILLFVELAILRKDRLYFALAGLSFGLQLLSGHPNIPIMTIIYVSLYILFRSKAKIGNFFIGIFIIVSTASIRGQGVDFVDATNSSFSLFDLVTFVFPNFFFNNINNSWAFANTWHFWGYWGQIETTGYIGVIILLFVFIAFLSRSYQKTSIFLLLLLVSFILAFGKNTPIYGFLLQLPFSFVSAAIYFPTNNCWLFNKQILSRIYDSFFRRQLWQIGLCTKPG